jgi:hypothetical protein
MLLLVSLVATPVPHAYYRVPVCLTSSPESLTSREPTALSIDVLVMGLVTGNGTWDTATGRFE